MHTACTRRMMNADECRAERSSREKRGGDDEEGKRGREESEG